MLIELTSTAEIIEQRAVDLLVLSGLNVETFQLAVQGAAFDTQRDGSSAFIASDLLKDVQ